MAVPKSTIKKKAGMRKIQVDSWRVTDGRGELTAV